MQMDKVSLVLLLTATHASGWRALSDNAPRMDLDTNTCTVARLDASSPLFARAFRDDERGPWHRSEFTMLEWYRAWAPLSSIEDDCEALVRTLAARANVSRLAGAAIDGPFERTTVREKVLSAIVDLMDTDGNGVRYDEFCAWLKAEDAKHLRLRR